MKRFSVGLALALTGCAIGGDLPGGPTRTQIHFNNFSVQGESVTFTDFTPTESGTLIVVVDWTFPSNDIDTFLLTPSCNIFVGPQGCGRPFAGDESFEKPAEFRYTGTIARQEYRVYIVNYGPRDDAGVVNVYLER